MKLAIVLLALVGICYVNDSCAMENSTKEIAKNMIKAQSLLERVENSIKQDADAWSITTNYPNNLKPIDLKPIFYKYEWYASSAEQVRILVQPIVDDKSIPFPVRQEAESFLDRALSIKNRYFSS